MGCIVRDSIGAMIIARTTSIMGAFPIREAEALSFNEALSWFKVRQVDRCIIETDSTQVVEALKNTSKRSLFSLNN